MDKKYNTTSDDVRKSSGASKQTPTVNLGKYLTFNIDEEIYGIYVMSVKEIVGLVDMTRVPRTPDFVKGVINLRGRVIPVIDLKKRFNAGAVDESSRTPIIIVEIKSTDKITEMGLLVDNVSDVMIVKEENLEPMPSFGIELETEFIDGIARFDEDVITLLNIDRILTSTEMIDIRKVKEKMISVAED